MGELYMTDKNGKMTKLGDVKSGVISYHTAVPESIAYLDMIKEMIDTCPADRIETLAEYVKQFDIIDEFAPKLMTDDEEIRNLILDAINGEIEMTNANRGKVMKIIAPVFKGKADMSVVSKVVGDMLM